MPTPSHFGMKFIYMPVGIIYLIMKVSQNCLEKSTRHILYKSQYFSKQHTLAILLPVSNGVLRVSLSDNNGSSFTQSSWNET